MERKKAEVPDPWERQEGETNKQFEAFCLYRDMGIDRSLRNVSNQLNKSVTLLGRWSSANRWVERCSEWDSEQDRLNRIQQQKAIAKMRETHARAAAIVVSKGLKALNELDIKNMSASDILKYITDGAKLERVSRGDIGEVVEQRDGGETAPPVTFYIPENNRDKGE